MAHPGSGFGAGSTEEFERLSRQYWGAWGEALRNAVPGAAPPDPARMAAQAWQDSIDWWTRQASGGGSPHGDTLWRFNRQASDWYAGMQQLAARFGSEGSAADIASAWKEAVGGASANVFADLARSMAGNGLHGVERWSEDAAPWLHLLRREGDAWLHMPAFGVTREHQERLQALAQAQLEVQEASNAFNTLLLRSSESAFEVFERLLAEREAPGLQITSARALFDLWIDAAEQAYAEMALSKDYRLAYGNLANAQMKLRAGVQKEVELASATLGMPTRGELDGAHRKIVELERAMRRLRDQLEQGASPAAAPGPAAPRRPAATPARRRNAARQGAATPARDASAPRAGAASDPASATQAQDARAAAPASSRAAATPPQARKPASKPAVSKRATAKPAASTRGAISAPAKRAAVKPAAPAPAAGAKGRSAGARNGTVAATPAKPVARTTARAAASRPSKSAGKAPARPSGGRQAFPTSIPDAPQPLGRRGR